jgi:hypothetical protein
MRMPLPIAPPLYFDGNLRVDIHCAESFETRDLHVTLDGAPLEPLHTNGVSSVAYGKHGVPYEVWSPTDVGFVAPPGLHRVRIAAPGCAPDERDIDIPADYPKFITGRLALSDDSLRGSTGAPDGGGLVLGAFTVARPARTGTQSDLWGGTTAYTVADGSAQGVLFGVSYERRGFVFSHDLGVGWGSLAGTVQTIKSPDGLSAYPGTLPYTGGFVMISDTLRIGKRIALHDVALAAGTGIGGDVTVTWRNVDESGVANKSTVFADGPNNTVDADWFVPVWASVTIKPWCDFGLQAVASYDVHPTALDESGLRISAGLLFQPSASCRDAPGVKVTPP